MAGNGRSHRAPQRPNAVHRDYKFNQESPFLRLPAEIRNLIYEYSLTKPDGTIDLCPGTYIDYCLDYSDNDLKERVEEYCQNGIVLPFHADFFEHPAGVGYFRYQHDLEYVRKNLAVGLLATCQQISREAYSYFWGKNIFRFSHDEQWQTVRQFLTTIGPRARKEIRTLQVRGPVAFKSRDRHPYPCGNGDEAWIFKDFPELCMQKVYYNPSSRKLQSRNAEFVENIIRTELRDTLQEVQLIIPDGCSTWTAVEATWEQLQQHELPKPDELVLHRRSGFEFHDMPWLNKTLVFESGSYLRMNEVHDISDGLCEGVHFGDLGLLMRTGSECISDEVPSVSEDFEWLAEISWARGERAWVWQQDQYFGPSRKNLEEDNSYYIKELFAEISVAACGGKVRNGPGKAMRGGKMNPLRILDGFGDCVFDQYVELCHNCATWGNGECDDCEDAHHTPWTCPERRKIHTLPKNIDREQIPYNWQRLK